MNRIPHHSLLSQATIDLALKVLEPTPSCPASSVAEQVLGSFTDPAAIREFAKSVDLLTVEIEHVDANALEVRAGYGSGCIASRGKGPS